MSVGMPECLKLEEFAWHLEHAFGEHPYQVGSSLLNKTGWRDVDIVIILDDEKFAAMGFGDPLSDRDRHENLRWRAYTLAFSELGRTMTGLPIDFKVQSMTEANDKTVHPGSRGAVGIRLRLAMQEFFCPGSTKPKGERRFPIMESDPKNGHRASIPWEIIEAHAAQVKSNHGQSLDQLAMRGGLSWAEALCALHDSPLSKIISDEPMAKSLVDILVSMSLNEN